MLFALAVWMPSVGFCEEGLVSYKPSLERIKEPVDVNDPLILRMIEFHKKEGLLYRQVIASRFASEGLKGVCQQLLNGLKGYTDKYKCAGGSCTREFFIQLLTADKSYIQDLRFKFMDWLDKVDKNEKNPDVVFEIMDFEDYLDSLLTRYESLVDEIDARLNVLRGLAYNR